MKKLCFAISIFLITQFLLVNPVFSQEKYKVIKVIDGDTVYIDFNGNSIAEQDEKVRLNGIDTFETKPTEFLDYQVKNYGFTQDEALGLGYLGKEFAKKKLLNKYVIAKYTGETARCDMGRKLMSIYYDNGKNYEEEVLKQGLAVVYKKSNLAPQLQKFENLGKIKAHASLFSDSEKPEQVCFFSRLFTKKARAHRLFLVLLNKKNGKYHKPTCEYGQMASDVELVQKPFFPNFKSSGCCYPKKLKTKKETSYKIYTKKVTPDIKSSDIELYFLSPLKQKKPANSCKTSACKALLYNIDNAKTSIDFAIYGIAGQDKIYNALVNAQKRGVKIRWVTDMTENNKNIYSDTTKLMKELPNVKTDYESADSLVIPDYKYKLKYQGALMHNKFFIFDNQKVFTGSTNISSTCLTGFNSNVAIIINSSGIADYYKKEFEQMYFGKFHNEKIKNEKPPLKIDNMIIYTYFSPTDKITSTKIIPYVQLAKDYIYIPAFYLTHRGLTDALIEAQIRGVDVRVILDETSVQGEYNTHKLLQNAGIPVKVEHWSGKMHQKSLIIDDNTVIIGSTNFTSQGENRNDENTLVITNAPILSMTYKKHFLQLWNSIKDDKVDKRFHFRHLRKTTEFHQEN